MHKLSLNGCWDLAWCDPGEGEQRNWPGEGVRRAEHVAASVPGDVHQDLTEAGVIDEPLYGRNAPDCHWMETKDWWYSRSFHLAPEQIGDVVELHFGGLDCTADVWLNGEPAGQADNAHIPHTFDVTKLVRPGRNLLVVRLDAGLRAVAQREMARYRMHDSDEPRVWIRKAQFTFEWDWAPRLVTCGIWRDVELRCYRETALRDLCLRTHREDDGSARVEVLAEVENFADEPLDVELEVCLRREQAHAVTLAGKLAPGTHVLEGELCLDDPDLWWPAPMGEPALYDVSARLEADGQFRDGRSFRHGLREVALLQEELPDDEGTSFVIAVNGRRVFCKGANWVPADSIIARITPARYRALISAAAEANFNMLRIWGGGIFEDDLFYQLCDEYGVLVWQDFMYSCAYYPDDDRQFVAESRREAEGAVRRLRNYACIALWCGNNENQWIHFQREQGGGAAERCFGEKIYDEVLPEVCRRLDPTRPYWPSSPYGGDDPNSEWEGDRHAWFVSILAPDLEQRIDYRLYERDRGKFVSEFGILAPPPLESLKRYLPPDEFHRSSPSWEMHNNKFEKGTNQEALRRYWKPADQLDLREYVRFSQMIQAEALKWSLEHWRRRKFRTAGALFWMYSDCWGEVGWTVIDYYLNRKPSYYAVKRAFAPVLVSLAEVEERVEVWLVNDLGEPVAGQLTWGWVNLRTGQVQQREAHAVASANDADPVVQLDLPRDDRAAWMAFARFESDGQVLSRNRRFLAGFQFNELDLPAARVETAMVEDGQALELTTDAFAWQVHLDVPGGVWVEDNDFDLLPGETRRVVVRGPAELVERITAEPLNRPEA